jgi:type 1 glutamine amidotransferase
MKFAALLLLSTFGLSCALHAQLRVHRIDKLGEDSLSSPSFDHTEARAEASVVFPELANEQGWDFTQSSDSERFTDEGLEAIDVIIFDNNTGILFNDSEKKAFEKWVRAGGAVVGIHGATHADKGVNDDNVAEWPFWYAMWGVLHKTGPKKGPSGRRGYADTIIMNGDKDLLSTSKVPMKWRLNLVEWYFWNYHDSYRETDVIATGEVKQNQPDLPANYPVTWRHEYQGGRIWYTNMGHYAENFHQEEFIQHLLDGIAWAAEKEPR